METKKVFLIGTIDEEFNVTTNTGNEEEEVS